MKLLTSQKQLYLLDASLEILHEESREWLNEIAFWRDEATFLFNLIRKKTNELVQVKAGTVSEKIENELSRISAVELDKLHETVIAHERYLSKMIKDKMNDQETYRYKHHELASEFREFDKHFKVVKKEIFDIAKR
jgi:hypothetical protein